MAKKTDYIGEEFNNESKNNKTRIDADFVGIDEQYVPNSNKTQNSTNQSNYSKENRQAKILAKGYLIWFIVFFVITFLSMIFFMFRMFNNEKTVKDKVSNISTNDLSNISNTAYDKSKISDYEVFEFNSDYTSTAKLSPASGFFVKTSINSAIAANEEGKYLVTVVYNDKEYKTAAEIKSIKDSFSSEKKYNFSYECEYETGLVNKLIISDAK